MKRRAQRLVIGAVAVLAGLVAILVAANWNTVRDHVEAWHFQLTRETETIQPMAGKVTVYADWWEVLLHEAADASRSSMIFDPQEEFPLLSQLVYDADPSNPDTVVVPVHTQEILAFFERNGYRLIKQHFPRRAYVVIRDPVALVVRSSETLMFPGSPGGPVAERLGHSGTERP